MWPKSGPLQDQDPAPEQPCTLDQPGAANRAPVLTDRGGQLSSACKFVLVGLANPAAPTAAAPFPSIATLVRYTGLPERTVGTECFIQRAPKGPCLESTGRTGGSSQLPAGVRPRQARGA
jgi:hypothetical protein